MRCGRRLEHSDFDLLYFLNIFGVK